jgi:hypothetical protein
MRDCEGLDELCDGVREWRRSSAGPTTGPNVAPHGVPFVVSDAATHDHPDAVAHASRWSDFATSGVHDGRGDEGGYGRRQDIRCDWAHGQQPAVRAVLDGMRDCEGLDELCDGVREWRRSLVGPTTGPNVAAAPGTGHCRPQTHLGRSTGSGVHDGRGDEGGDGRRQDIRCGWAHGQQPAVRAVLDGVRDCEGLDELCDGVREWRRSLVGPTTARRTPTTARDPCTTAGS